MFKFKIEIKNNQLIADTRIGNMLIITEIEKDEKNYILNRKYVKNGIPKYTHDNEELVNYNGKLVLVELCHATGFTMKFLDYLMKTIEGTKTTGIDLLGKKKPIINGHVFHDHIIINKTSTKEEPILKWLDYTPKV